MSRAFDGTNDSLTGAPPVTGVPFSVGVDSARTTISADDVCVAIGDDGTDFNCFRLGWLSSNAPYFRTRTGAATGDAITSGSTTSTDWVNLLGTTSAVDARAAYRDGANKGTNATSSTPTGVDEMQVGENNAGSQDYAGKLAHLCIWSRALSDLEALYYGTGGNPRYVKNLTHYWKLTAGASPETPSVGTGDLTVNGTGGTDASNPTRGTYFTGSSYSDQSWSEDDAISSLTVDARFDDVASAFTTSFKILGTPSNETTTNGTGTNAREIILTSAAAFSAGDYLKITSGGSPILILAKSSNTLLLGADATWSTGQDVYRFAVGNASITGVSISAGSLTGTPTTPQASTPFYFFRATNDANSALIADSNLFSIEVTADATPPAFSVAPSVTATSDEGYTVSFTADSSADVHVVALAKGSATPNPAAVIAHTNALAFATKSVTGADSVTLTGLDFPDHDLYGVLTNGAGDSTVASMLNERKDPPTGYQYITIDVPWGMGAESILEDADPAAVDGDVIECSTVTSPGGYTITMGADGVASIAAGGDTSRQSFNARFYDVSIADWSDDPAVTFYVNNQAPTVNNPAAVFVYPIDEAIDAEDDTGLAEDFEDEDLVVTDLDALPTGLSRSGSTPYEVTGTPTVQGIHHTSTRWTDIAGDSADSTITRLIGNMVVPDVVGELDGAGIDLIEAAYLAYTLVPQASEEDVGIIIDQDPAAEAEVAPYSVVTLTVSSGPEAVLNATIAALRNNQRSRRLFRVR